MVGNICVRQLLYTTRYNQNQMNKQHNKMLYQYSILYIYRCTIHMGYHEVKDNNALHYRANIKHIHVSSFG